MLARSKLVLDDRGEGVGLEAGAADQCAVDLFLADERGGVVGLDAAAVEDAHGRGNIGAQQLGHFGADDLVRVGGDLGRGGLAGADGPDRLIGNDDGRGGLGGDAGECAGDLGLEHVGGLVRLRARPALRRCKRWE